MLHGLLPLGHVGRPHEGALRGRRRRERVRARGARGRRPDAPAVGRLAEPSRAVGAGHQPGRGRAGEQRQQRAGADEPDPRPAGARPAAAVRRRGPRGSGVQHRRRGLARLHVPVQLDPRRGPQGARGLLPELLRGLPRGGADAAVRVGAHGRVAGHLLPRPRPHVRAQRSLSAVSRLRDRADVVLVTAFFVATPVPILVDEKDEDREESSVLALLSHALREHRDISRDRRRCLRR